MHIGEVVDMATRFTRAFYQPPLCLFVAFIYAFIKLINYQFY